MTSGRSDRDIMDDIYNRVEEPSFKDRREEHIWMLERRARHLQRRIRASDDKVLTMDKKELQALRWVLSEVDG